MRRSRDRDRVLQAPRSSNRLPGIRSGRARQPAGGRAFGDRAGRGDQAITLTGRNTPSVFGQLTDRTEFTAVNEAAAVELQMLLIAPLTCGALPVGANTVLEAKGGCAARAVHREA